MVATAVEPAGPVVAAALRLADREQAVRIESLGTADGTAISRATSWFSAQRFPGIAAVFARTGSITAALAECGVPDYRRASTAIEARHADEADTRELQLAPGAIVIVTRAVNVDPAGEPIQYSVTRFAADRVEIQVGGR